MTWSRRRLLRAGGGAMAGTWMATSAKLAAAQSATATSTSAAAEYLGSKTKRIALSNLHSNETIDVVYSREGAYVAESLQRIDTVLRDWRNGERHVIDPRLVDYLTEVAQQLGAKPHFEVISGYRSPETNRALHERSTGVSQHSLHMEGRAIDVRMPGVDCAELAARALQLQRGGVGYYRASNFVHLDTGSFRSWRG